MGLLVTMKRLLTPSNSSVNCLIKRIRQFRSNTSVSSVDQQHPDKENELSDQNAARSVPEADMNQFYDFNESFKASNEWTSKLLSSMLLYLNFVSSEEETAILKEVEPYMKRLHYESSHWDDAIHNYRETERAKWNQKNTKVIERIKRECFPPGVPQLRFVHILDLEKTGVIKPHIDSVRFCGNTIAGLSLLSNSIMRLRHDVKKDYCCDILLPRLSLYVMKDFARYEFTHEILGETESRFKNKAIPRDRRISVICRNEPDMSTEAPTFKPLES